MELKNHIKAMWTHFQGLKIDKAMLFYEDSNHKLQYIDLTSQQNNSMSVDLTFTSIIPHLKKIQGKEIVLAHNHPFPDPTPSLGDLGYTNNFERFFALIGIRLTDSVILSSAGYYSLARAGKMEFPEPLKSPVLDEKPAMLTSISSINTANDLTNQLPAMVSLFENYNEIFVTPSQTYAALSFSAATLTHFYQNHYGEGIWITNHEENHRFDLLTSVINPMEYFTFRNGELLPAYLSV